MINKYHCDTIGRTFTNMTQESWVETIGVNEKGTKCMDSPKCKRYTTYQINSPIIKEWNTGDGNRQILPENNYHKYVHIILYRRIKGTRNKMWGGILSPRNWAVKKLSKIKIFWPSCRGIPTTLHNITLYHLYRSSWKICLLPPGGQFGRIIKQKGW